MSSAYHLAITRFASVIVATALMLAAVAFSQLEKVRLDASSDSLLLQGDPELAFFEEATERYESYEFLIMTWELPCHDEKFVTLVTLRCLLKKRELRITLQ